MPAAEDFSLRPPITDTVEPSAAAKALAALEDANAVRVVLEEKANLALAASGATKQLYQHEAEKAHIAAVSADGKQPNDELKESNAGLTAESLTKRTRPSYRQILKSSA